MSPNIVSPRNHPTTLILKLGVIGVCAWAVTVGCEKTSEGEGSESRTTAPVSCPPTPYYRADGGFEPSISPLGFVDGGVYGCYAPREQASAGWISTTPANACPGTSSSCTYAPTDLPCGACPSETEACEMSVVAVCECGRGPFIDIYSDQWVCRCDNGQWDCRVVAPSGASCQICFDACFQESRSTPYSTGMISTGPSGVTVALTSVPEPPTLFFENVWTLMIQDSGGAPITGAAVTVSPFMPDHGHGSAVPVTVTEIGGGEYRATPVSFSLPGYWETTVQVTLAPIDENVVIKLCVQ